MVTLGIAVFCWAILVVLLLHSIWPKPNKAIQNHYRSSGKTVSISDIAGPVFANGKFLYSPELKLYFWTPSETASLEVLPEDALLIESISGMKGKRVLQRIRPGIAILPIGISTICIDFD